MVKNWFSIIPPTLLEVKDTVTDKNSLSIGTNYRMGEPCESSAMQGNIWWFGVFRLSQDRGYQTVRGGCQRRAGGSGTNHGNTSAPAPVHVDRDM